VVKCHSKRYSKNGLIHKVTFWCDWGDKYVVTVNDVYQKRWTTGTWLQECLIWVNALWKDEGWILTVPHSEHNHSPTIESSHPALRKLNSDIQKTIVKQSAAEITSEQIVTALQNTNSLMPLIKQDVYNTKAHLKHKALGLHTPIQALMLALNDNYIFIYTKDHWNWV